MVHPAGHERQDEWNILFRAEHFLVTRVIQLRNAFATSEVPWALTAIDSTEIHTLPLKRCVQAEAPPCENWLEELRQPDGLAG
jgi:hypothetical protein